MEKSHGLITGYSLQLVDLKLCMLNKMHNAVHVDVHITDRFGQDESRVLADFVLSHSSIFSNLYVKTFKS